ncbi:hypothetical protein Lesp02_02740 [Lentzea sp. NBRC 105346]|uniref:hypothetical protein n=1 Tax=Lentzea sp. NBRC 105346 TaxID=3032205 RepID=UPI0024A1CC38|nr:hypothetical protein [Lentzea sp. NBRC 105346]GLZ28084.1 hypothetical protein Lesp02_02740 [Lentzea sp. NBRC 105346]
MTTQTDDRHVACSSQMSTRSVLLTEAVGCTPSAPSSASPGGELPRHGTVATHPPTAAADLYENGLGWPVLTQGADVFLRGGQRVDIVAMPRALAGQVNNSLKLLRLDAAVLEVEGETLRWAFFCQSQPPSITNLGILSLRGVNHYGTGSLFLLPPDPTHNSETLRWICPPMSGVSVLPAIATVISCAQTALR